MSDRVERRDLDHHVPRVVREWVADDPDPATMHRSIAGSMLFADVSGFTKMSERLARRGRVGSETVAEIIDTCFTRMLTEAYRFGGTLLQFGGDAVLLFFRGAEHERRAAAAALEMRQALRGTRDLTHAAAGVRLSMTVGVHSGDFDLFLVGTSHRQLVVGGPVASRLVELEAAAEHGRILISDANAHALNAGNVGPISGPGRQLRGRVDVASDHTVRFLPSGQDMSGFVAAGLLPVVGAGRVQSEHRTATVAFVEYRGLDRVIAEQGADAAARRLHALVSGTQRAIDHREICFQSADLAVDGGKFYLSVGAPRSTGHDEEHMLLALREIVGLDVGLRLRAGVNSGPVFTGEIASPHRSTFITMGDPVNLAARVMSKASSGEVWATRTVIDRSRTLFHTRPVPPFLVKGKSRPVEAFAVGAARGTRSGIATTELPIVGRDDELDRFRAALEAARRGAGTYLRVVAEPGAGKSRLLDEFARSAADVPFHRVKCRLYQATTPYFPFSELLPPLLELEHDPASAHLGLVRLLGDRTPDLVPWASLIGTAAGLDIPLSDDIERLEPEYRKPQLESAVVTLLDQLLVGPIVICIEDAHWMDDASTDLFDALAADLGGRPWVLLVARRPDARPTASSIRPADAELELRPLDDTSLTRLVAVAAPSDPPPPHVVATLVARSGGNPLFLLELLDAVRAGGDLDALPTSIDGLLTARIDRLAAHDRTVLRHLAVLGTGFESRYMVDVLPNGMGSDPIETVRRLGEFLAVDAQQWVSFRHNLLRDVAYEGLPYRTRRHLHEQVAESVLVRVGDDVDEVAALLSLHYFRAGRNAEAWRFSRLAGDRAKEVYANTEAATLYRRALAASAHLEIDDAERSTALELLGDVQDLAGRYTEARASYAAARRLRRDDAVVAARLLLKSAFVDERLGRFVGAVRSIRRAERLLVDAPAAADGLRAQLAGWYAAIRLRQGRFVEAIAASETAIELAQVSAERATLARAYLTLDYARSSLGRHVDVTGSSRALEIATELGDLGGEATAANVLGGYAFLAGRWDEAAGLYRRARAARERTGDPDGVAICNANLAEILVEQGRLDEADELLAEVLSVWRAADDAGGVAFACKLRGTGRARAGDFGSATGLLAEARRGFAAIGAATDVVETDVAIAEKLLLEGRPTDAVTLLGTVLADLDVEGIDHLRPAIHRIRGMALLESDPGTARQEVETALAHARERDAVHEIARALGSFVTIAARTGERVDDAVLDELAQLRDRLGIESERRTDGADPISGSGTPGRRRT